MPGSTEVRERGSRPKGQEKLHRNDKHGITSSVLSETTQGASGDLGAEKAVTGPDHRHPVNRTSKEKGRKESPGFLSSCWSKARYFILLIFIPPFLNYASLQREAVELKPAGELYDIGWGQKLFLSCQGKGPPTVVLDAPTGMTSDVWTLVAAKLSQHANVCVYDRAGLGFSDRPANHSARPNGHLNSGSQIQGTPFTVERMVEDLHKLVTSSSQQPLPFILVGAELGAIVGQFYAQVYEENTAGLVLVNPLPENLFTESDEVWAHYWFGSVSPMYQSLQLGAALGITRLGLLTGLLKQPITGDLVPEEVLLRQKYLLCHPRHLSSVVDEHYFINETLAQMRTLRKIKRLSSGIPVSVLTGNYYDEQMPSHLNRAWARAEQDVLARLPQGTQHLVVNGADRHMMYRRPEPLVETVFKMIRKWRRTKEAMNGNNSSFHTAKHTLE